MAEINLQMYSFADGTMEDSRENLRMAAQMGYAGVELFGPNFQIPAEEMKELLKNLNLRAVSLHTDTDSAVNMIPYAKVLGLAFIGIGMQTLLCDADVHAFAAALNSIGRTCAENGIALTYHNHTQEFAPCEGKRIIDVLLAETEPELVSMELDAGWCAAAGFSPEKFVREYPGRVKLIHIKESSCVIGPQPPMDWAKVPRDEKGIPVFTQAQKDDMQRQKKINCPAGAGLVDWAELKRIADANGCRHYIVEREFTPAPYASRLEVLTADIRYYSSVLD